MDQREPSRLEKRQASRPVAQHAARLRLPRDRRSVRGRCQHRAGAQGAAPIWITKTETAARVRGRIEKVLAAAERLGLRAEGKNPATWRNHLDTLLPAKSRVHKTKHHPAMPYQDVPAFMARLRAKQGAAARALELAILTATRTKETRQAPFVEFDLDAKVWSIPAERMKAGQPHRVPLCDRAVAIVTEMAAPRVNGFVFPGREHGKPLSELPMALALRELVSGVTVHGFRSSF